MVFEQFLDSEKIKNNTLYIFILAIFYTFTGFAVAKIFFPNAISIAMLFAITLFLIPSINALLKLEEKIESKEGLKHFLSNHKKIIKIYVVLLFGIFIGFFVIHQFSETNFFNYQMNFLETRGDLTSDDFNPTTTDLFNLISHNLTVVILSFALSIFYGAGALFLIVFNASIFATFIFYMSRMLNNTTIVPIFFIHLIPEITGFLIAAIAGGVVSKAIMHEKFRSIGFRNVMKDSIVLLLIAVLFIIIAAILELFVTRPLVI